MPEVAAEDVEEDVNEVEQDTSKEVVEGAAAHMRMELTSQILPVTLKIQSGLHSQRIQGKVSLRTRYAQSSRKMKIGAPPAMLVPERSLLLPIQIHFGLRFEPH